MLDLTDNLGRNTVHHSELRTFNPTPQSKPNSMNVINGQLSPLAALTEYVEDILGAGSISQIVNPVVFRVSVVV